MKGRLLEISALGLPQLQHLLCCGVAGSSSYYTLSAKIQLPEWQSKLKRKNSCWWDSWLCDQPQQNKTWWEEKAKHLCSFEQKFTRLQISKGIHSAVYKSCYSQCCTAHEHSCPSDHDAVLSRGLPYMSWWDCRALCPYCWGTGGASRGTVHFCQNKGNGEYVISVIAEASFLLDTFLFEFGLTVVFKTECNHRIN